MDKPETGVLITIWIAIMAFYYPIILDALQHPDWAHFWAGIITLLGGSIAAILVSYIWDEQYKLGKRTQEKIPK